MHAGDGRVVLNASWCRVDAFVFEQMVDAGEPAVGSEALLDLYRGHFLPGDGDEPWLVATRERLRSKFLRTVESLGAELVLDGKLEEAIALYRRATEIDPVAEGAYRGLMNGLARLGRQAEALEAYRRCRHMLSVVLGVKPGRETEALHTSLLAMSPSRTMPGSAAG